MKYSREKAVLRAYETTQVEVTEEGNYERTHFCN
jgi:hypothetical protein